MHDDEIRMDGAAVRELVDTQFPQWSHLSLSPAGHGTDNRMLRLGDELVLRLPRTPGVAADIAKEQRWLPKLAPHLPVAVPEPVAVGEATTDYPLAWGVYRWVPGSPVEPDSLDHPERFGAQLADFVAALHGIDLMGATRSGDLEMYRGGELSQLDETVSDNLAKCRRIDGLELDLDTLRRLWNEALALEVPPKAHTWMHADLKPSNLLHSDGALVGVIDFGTLSVGDPTCEHAAVWDLPAAARHSYADALGLDAGTRIRARAWALAIALSGVPYYWETWPQFVDECLARLRAIADSAGEL